jgi:DMSO/TMAO reductase YedYZ molybdopterin-dependent catalytic subunit
MLRWGGQGGEPASLRGTRGSAGRPISRRAFVSIVGLAAAGLATWSIPELLDRLGGQPRRFTGSRIIAGSGGVPSTTFLGEPSPAIDRNDWRLRVTGDVARVLELDQLALAAPELSEMTAVLDCTSGWAYEGRWRGIALATLLDRAGVQQTAQGIEIRSVTGWTSRLTIEEARGSLVATHLDGQLLGPEHGAPCRLVVPMRRGLDWVKWLAEVRVA